MAVRATDPEPDYTKSTGAFPLSTEPAVVYEPDPGVDYSKSTDAFPMYDDRNPREVVAKHVDAEVKPTYTTPGPVTHGESKAAAAQRQELGLSPDLSGDSDAGYAARPSTVTALPIKKVVDPPPPAAKPKAATQATGK